MNNKEWHYLLGLNDDETESDLYSIWASNGYLITEFLSYHQAKSIVEKHNKDVQEKEENGKSNN